MCIECYWEEMASTDHASIHTYAIQYISETKNRKDSVLVYHAVAISHAFLIDLGLALRNRVHSRSESKLPILGSRPLRNSSIRFSGLRSVDIGDSDDVDNLEIDKLDIAKGNNTE